MKKDKRSKMQRQKASERKTLTNAEKVIVKAEKDRLFTIKQKKAETVKRAQEYVRDAEIELSSSPAASDPAPLWQLPQSTIPTDTTTNDTTTDQGTIEIG